MDYVVVPIDAPQVVVVQKRVNSPRVVEIGVPGPRGAQGPQGEIGLPGGSTSTRKASVALSGHRAVLVDALGCFDYASSGNAAHSHRVVGVTTGAASAGLDAVAQLFGEIVEPSWNWVADQPIYLGIDGVLTQMPPVQPGSKFLLVIGFPISATSMYVNIQQPINIL